MKRVLLLNSDLSTGGAERAMSIIANELSAKGYNVSMALLRDNPKVYSISENINLIQFDNTAKGKARKLINRIRNIRTCIKKIKPDDVITFTYHNNIVLSIATIGLKTKTIISERLHPLYNSRCEKFKFWELYIIKKLYRRCDYLVFQTNVAMSCFPSFKTKPNCLVIPNAISKQSLKWEFDHSDCTIIAAGRFTLQKNFALLIKSFTKFHKTHSSYKLYIYGDGPLKNELNNQISVNNMTNNIYLPGYNSNLHDKMRRARMYVSSSNFEGISNCMLEALSIGLPTICTNCPVGGAELMINNMENGILVDTEDENQLVDAMCMIADNEELCNILSKNAIKSCEDYSPEKIVELWEEIL